MNTSQCKIFPLKCTVFLLGKCRFTQEEIHLRFHLKFAMVSCDKLLYKICVNRWCNLVPRLSFLRWVKQAWRDIPEEMVRRSFKTCGISITAQRTMQSLTIIIVPEEKKSEDKEMDDEFKTDSEEEDQQ